MITLQNMIFANPQAYQVFPNMVNTYNTGTMEKAVYTGHIVITDSSGNTHNFTNTNTIDFTPISGLVTIDNITDRGSVRLGRWQIAQSIVITNDITITVTPIAEVSSDGATITPQYEVKHNTYHNGELTESTVITPDNVTLQSNVEWITISNNQIVVAANTNTEARQGQVTIQVSYQQYNTSANYNIIQAGYSIEDGIMDAMVLWYDLAKQGATNESMATTPTLIDHSGNGHDATCYNFAWTEESGISTTNYPHALVSDGVDDYCLVEGLPLLNKEDGYTVIAKRTWISDVNSKSQGFVSKGSGVAWVNGAFYFEGVEGGGSTLFNRVFDNVNGQRGVNAVNNFIQEDVTYLTSAKYNNSDIVNVGDGVDTDKLVVFRLATSAHNFYASISLYSLLLFNRDLTSEEIEWVKTNLIESEQ